MGEFWGREVEWEIVPAIGYLAVCIAWLHKLKVAAVRRRPCSKVLQADSYVGWLPI
jgi:hypothetical protein